jgi:hypothetical protein
MYQQASLDGDGHEAGIIEFHGRKAVSATCRNQNKGKRFGPKWSAYTSAAHRMHFLIPFLKKAENHSECT